MISQDKSADAVAVDNNHDIHSMTHTLVHKYTQQIVTFLHSIWHLVLNIDHANDKWLHIHTVHTYVHIIYITMTNMQTWCLHTLHLHRILRHMVTYFGLDEFMTLTLSSLN